MYACVLCIALNIMMYVLNHAFQKEAIPSFQQSHHQGNLPTVAAAAIVNAPTFYHFIV